MGSQFTRTDVVVIGGGMAGLSAACYLAQADVAVTLFERSTLLGGRGTTQKYDEYSFNRGIHALYCGGAAEHVLKELGVSYSGHSPRGVFALRQGKLHVFPADPLTLLRTDLLDVGDKLELIRLFTVFLRLKAQEQQRVSVQEWLEKNIHRPRLRQAMAGLARTYAYSAALDLVSAEVFLVKMQQVLKYDILYIDGGWQTLVDGLRKVAERAGVQIMNGVRVEAVEYQEGRVQGVRLRDGRNIKASSVIIATDPQETMKLLGAGVCSELERQVEASHPIQVACLDVALSSLPSARYPVVQDLYYPRFMSIQSLFARIAPQGGTIIHAFKQLDHRYPTDPREDERELEDLLDMLQPGWHDVLVKRVYLPRIEASGWLPTASSSGFAGRPGSEIPGVANLYLAGDWIGPEGFLIDASLASARRAAQLLLESGSFSIENKVVTGSRS